VSGQMLFPSSGITIRDTVTECSIFLKNSLMQVLECTAPAGVHTIQAVDSMFFVGHIRYPLADLRLNNCDCAISLISVNEIEAKDTNLYNNPLMIVTTCIGVGSKNRFRTSGIRGMGSPVTWVLPDTINTWILVDDYTNYRSEWVGLPIPNKNLMSSGTSRVIYPEGGADGYEGVTVTGILGEAVAFGEVLYRSAGVWFKARGDVGATMPVRAICVQGGGIGETVLLLRSGYVRDTSWAWTDGNELYVSVGTAGALQNTVPAVPGEIAQIVGVAEDTDLVWFDLNSATAEVA